MLAPYSFDRDKLSGERNLANICMFTCVGARNNVVGIVVHNHVLHYHVAHAQAVYWKKCRHSADLYMYV